MAKKNADATFGPAGSTHNTGGDDLKVLIYSDDKAEIVWPGQEAMSPMRDAKVVETIAVDVGDKMRKALPKIAGLDEILEQDCQISQLMEMVAEAVRNTTLKKTHR